MGSIKDRNGMDLTEAEDIKKRWQEYTEELYKKDLHDPRDCSLPGSSTHGVFQARVLEWGAIAGSRRSCIQSAKTRLGADCGSDHETLIAKFRLKLKKVGETTRPFWYDINQIPYDCTVEVRNRFKGLDLIEHLMNYGRKFMTLYRRQGSRPSPWKTNAKKQNGCLGRPYK